jgi:hypothetical protein
MSAADDLRALSTAATPGPWRLNDSEHYRAPQVLMAPGEGGVRISGLRDSADAALIVALRNRAAAIVDLADAVKAVPRHRYPDEKTGTCFRCFLPWPCPTERAHRALDALEANRA